MTACIFLWFFSLLSVAHAGPSPQSTWEQTIDKVTPAVVAIRVTGTRDFDTEQARSSVGTGFVVDIEQGLILTNRHMVHAGPVKAEAVFLNHEEVELQAIYRDPVHDFGFYRFNPDDVKFMELSALTLMPDSARVGMEIRVIGNDSGEKISILDGTLARLDRSAPRYGGNTYNDFNTFYLQAASNTSGGSSGSPVVSLDGHVVGLNAGGKTQAASSFYLPLDRVVRALDLIRSGAPVTRGTIQTVFQYTAFDELKRLGLRAETEARLREFPDAIGGLVVLEIIPEGPGWNKLQPGDILVSINGKLLYHFVELERILDSSIGEAISIGVERGGEELTFPMDVADLHAITPAEYLEYGRGVFHTLSYQQARNHALPPRGVYVTLPGFSFGNAGIPRRSIIRSINGEPVPDLNTFQAMLERLPHGSRARVRYFSVQDPNHERESVIVSDRLWYSMRRCVRDDKVGQWPCTEAKAAPEATPLPPVDVTTRPLGNRITKKLADALVLVDFDIPYPTGGVKDFNYQGTGLVIDAERGLVLVDRDTIPINLGDILLTFGGQARIPGTLIYLHPVHNFGVIQFDPKHLGQSKIRGAEFSKKEPKKGGRVWQVALNSSHQLVTRKTRIKKVKALHMGIAGTPRYRDANVEGLEIGEALPSMGGVLADRRGRVVATWSSFLDQREDDRTFYGLPASFIQPVTSQIIAGGPVAYRGLGVEFWPLPLADARDLGLSEARATKLFDAAPDKGKVLRVIRRWGGTPASEVLRDGDLLLEVNGETVTRMVELEQLNDADQVDFLVLRDGQEVPVSLDTVPLVGTGIQRVVSWAGVVVHEPHLEVSAQAGRVMEGVYMAWMWYGSPGARYGLRPTRRIIEIDGLPTPDLDAFIRVVASHKDGQSIRIKMESMDNKVTVRTLKLDLQYWPTQLMQSHANGWSRKPLSNTLDAE